MRLIVLRHGRTAWNLEGRLQGRADIGLDPIGMREVGEWRCPGYWRDLPCWVSPLRRARQTADLLGRDVVQIAPELIEMDWGSFEGRRLADLRAEHGSDLAANEARGLDFRPPGGESPREVMGRVAPWLRSRADDGVDALAITHKGVRRALLALASGWDMHGPPPLKVGNHAAMELELDGRGQLAVVGVVALGSCHA
ncbi:MAG: histidine phosphatase family protein [Geminicoccaceae bacterium]